MSVDLFGDAVVIVNAHEPKRKPTIRRGYAAPPGTGPAGETCKTCEHCVRCGHNNKHYLKCELRKPSWTHGEGTDILAKSPACSKWERVLADKERV